MRKFAFVIFTDDIRQLRKLYRGFSFLPRFAINSICKNMPAFTVYHAREIRSLQGKEIEGYFIICPLFPNVYMAGLHKEFVMDRVMSAGALARRLGVNLLGLENFPLAAAEKQYAISHTLKLPLTTGKTLTAWSIYESVYRVAKAKGLDLGGLTISVLGVTNPLGRLCAVKCLGLGAKLIIFDWNIDKLNQAKERIIELSRALDESSRLGSLFAKDNLSVAVAEADIIINAEGLDEDKFIDRAKKGAVIFNICGCDAKGSNNGFANVSIIRAGLVRPPYEVKLGLNTGLPVGIICTSLAETMLLSFEEKFVNYSLGEKINPDNLEEIANMATRHGFEVWVPEAPVL